ncbi:MAG: FAD-dependent oxidoreductase [Rhodocyclaceae bacterium]|nr:FAD-dependent oxidoreductase [Rhodocyclaceae bacterium]MCP5233970.1 FAD-dependent oxidoreductase [Zoogloeaceae bacterium]MBX3687177.1 FAD-dependent oxidoreductase [Rhodocyclaceae bacterium]MCB1913173.1 FAD-dependent oxidoreductase [Rhodocyclaceae bacterium]MCP5240678.1 FAD-dependent oxidoreductase [Zoogloeaceae bacterium]
MLSTYQYPKFEYRCPPELSAGAEAQVVHHPVVVVGAGPVGLAAAIDLAMQGQRVLLIDNDDTVSIGSRGVCYAKRTLEVLDRLGCGEEMVAKGVTWNVGRTFFREDEVYNFNLCPQPDHHRPGMINLQQYYLEDYLVQRASTLPQLEMRWKSNVVSVSPGEDMVTLKVETPDGIYHLETDWLVVADGARSPIRTMLGLDIEGKVFMDRFLIADVVMKADFPTERWFWFDPPFHRNQSVLLHRQADNVFRIDFQLGWDADPQEEKKPEKVIPRIKAMLGDEREFELEWVSVYTFQCRRMHDFRHGRVMFVGDAAHQVSPFGARGANSGIQDSDNLVWKLKLVMDGKAPPRLLDTYSEERGFAADENLSNSTRSTDFITPKSTTSKTFRNAVLGLAEHYPFARALVNSGRLSVPAYLTDSRLNTADAESFAGNMVPGAAMDDAPIEAAGGQRWLLEVAGNRFQLLYFADDAAAIDAATAQALASLAEAPIPVEPVVVAASGTAPAGLLTLIDTRGRIAERYDLRAGSCYLIRPDQHVAARWRALDPAAVRTALAVATCNA